MRRIFVALMLVAVALSGCADPTGQATEEETTAADEELQATDTTGVIRGVVVDASIVPIAGASVRIDSVGMETETLEDGSFGFAGLDEGAYFLKIAKPGYVATQSSVSVEAGVDKPPIVRVQLAFDEGYNPYYVLNHYKGLYQCGTSVLVVCGAPNILLGSGTTEDTSTPTIDVPGTPDWMQTEMVWKSTQALSPQLYFEVESLDDGCQRDSDDGSYLLYNAEGVSPIKGATNGTDLLRHNIGLPDCGAYHSVFAGDTLEEQHCVHPRPNPVYNGCPGVGFSIQQEFEWFITLFYGYQPPDDYWFIEDGEYLPE